MGTARRRNQAQITALLVGLLGGGSLEAKSNAAASLWRLVQENPKSRQEIASAGAAEDVIALLKVCTSYLVPLTSYLLLLTSYVLPLTSCLLLLTSYFLPLTSCLFAQGGERRRKGPTL